MTIGIGNEWDPGDPPEIHAEGAAGRRAMTTDAYEYIRLYVDLGDLSELNSLSGTGWHVVAAIPSGTYGIMVLLERTLPR